METYSSKTQEYENMSVCLESTGFQQANDGTGIDNLKDVIFYPSDDLHQPFDKSEQIIQCHRELLDRIKMQQHIDMFCTQLQKVIRVELVQFISNKNLSSFQMQELAQSTNCLFQDIRQKYRNNLLQLLSYEEKKISNYSPYDSYLQTLVQNEQKDKVFNQKMKEQYHYQKLFEEDIIESQTYIQSSTFSDYFKPNVQKSIDENVKKKDYANIFTCQTFKNPYPPPSKHQPFDLYDIIGYPKWDLTKDAYNNCFKHVVNELQSKIFQPILLYITGKHKVRLKDMKNYINKGLQKHVSKKMICQKLNLQDDQDFKLSLRRSFYEFLQYYLQYHYDDYIIKSKKIVSYEAQMIYREVAKRLIDGSYKKRGI